MRHMACSMYIDIVCSIKNWELVITSGEACYEVIFECLDDTFSGIYTMIMWLDNLEVNVG